MNRTAEKKVIRFIPALLSLQESATNTILENIGRYSRDLFKKTIAPPMRKILFDILMERKKKIGEEQVWAALPYLDQHKTTERFSTRDFASIFRLERKSVGFSAARVSMEEFLQYLVEFVPNLKKLEIEDPRTSLNKELFKEIQLQPAATDLLLKMENLTEVGIDGVYINFTEFVRVCRESSNLQSIRALNILLDMETINSRNNLETLHSKFNYHWYDEWKFPGKIVITLKKTNDVKPHREAVATLSNNFLDMIPSALTELRITACKRTDIKSERNRLLHHLCRVGKTLRTLVLSCLRAESKISFKLIFEHCIALESLTVISSYVADDEPIYSFGKLKEFHFTNFISDAENLRGTVRLDKIFCAPHLQEISIRFLKIELGDVDSLLNQIRNRMILTELTKIQILYQGDPTQKDFNKEGLQKLARELCSLDVEVTTNF